MVIERFAGNEMGPVYRRLAERGRMMPDGVAYVTSWVAKDFSTCWQVMECDDRAKLDEWMANWEGTGVTYESIVPVVTSDEARAAWTAASSGGNG
jgi:hypothetical protein